MDKIRNRWLIAASAVGIHISIGSVYAYSVWVLPLNALHGWQKADISMAFSLAILLLGFSAAFLGPKVEAMGPRNSGRMAGCFYMAGYLGSALAVHLGSLLMFIICFGIIGGIGLGTGYITPVSTLVKWFPDNRGLATGMAIMGFGFGSMVFGPIIAYLCTTVGPALAFLILGIVFFILMFSSSLYLAPPPPGWAPANKEKRREEQTPEQARPDLAYMLAKEALRTKRFYFMWIMMFINISCGIGLISVASPMAQQVTGLSALRAASLVGFMGLFNGLGRIVWSSLSDYIGRPVTFIVFFLIQICAYPVLSATSSPFLFQALLLLIMTCYGGGFSTLPAFLSDMFGLRQLGTIHGYTLTAWGIAGIVGPALVNRMFDYLGSYTYTLYIFTGMFVLALVVSLLMARNIAFLTKQKQQAMSNLKDDVSASA